MKIFTVLLSFALACGWVAAVPAQSKANAKLSASGFKDCPECPEMAKIPSGSFMMGSPADEPGRKEDEGPLAKLSVRSFAVGKFAITRGQWAAFVTATNYPDGIGCSWSGPDKSRNATSSWRNLAFEQDDNHPVVCISWNAAQDYIQWLSKKTGRPYRMLTEAEWEYAARAGTTTAYPWGPTASHEHANYGAETCCSALAEGRDVWLYTAPVGSFPANAFGLYDMIGNAWQWVQDCYVGTLNGRPSDGSAVDKQGCEYRVARGGTWGDYPALIRSASRNYAPPPGGRTIKDYRSGGFGLRVATDVTAMPR